MQLTKVLKMTDDEMKPIWQNLEMAYTESTSHLLLREKVTKLHSSITANEII